MTAFIEGLVTDKDYQDAVLACEAGCEGIVLSNHGGVCAAGV
jgi:hypothetical protein